MRKLISVLFLANLMYASMIYEKERNNYSRSSNVKTITSVNDIGVGKNNYYYRYGYNDIDWWKFVAPKNGTLRIYTTNFNGNLDAYVYDSYGLYKRDVSSNPNANIILNAIKGRTYYIGLTTSKGTSNYNLRFEYINVTTREREFSLRKQFNIHGDYKMVGNGVLCFKYNNKCRDVYQHGHFLYFSDNNGKYFPAPNNNIQLSYINTLKRNFIKVNGKNVRVINASEAKISGIPDNAIIKWVGFYTQGDRKDDSKEQLISRLLSNPSYLIAPNGDKYEITPTQIDMYSFGVVLPFSTFAEVKALEGKKGSYFNGWWTGVNIQTQKGWDGNLGFFGAWNIVVVYEDKGLHLKNISIFDGYKYVHMVKGHNNVKIPVKGFLTPMHGDVHSKISVFTGEGDAAFIGDRLYLKNSHSSTYININKGTKRENNAFDSSVSGFETIPNIINKYGIDIHNYNVGTDGLNIIKNGDTSAILKFYSEGDAYFPSLFVFSTDLYEPRVCYYIDSIIDKEGNVVFKNGKFISDKKIYPNEEYNVTVWISNMKRDRKDFNIEDAKKVKIFLNFHNFNYKENSTLMKNIGWSSFKHQTDIPNDDLFTYWSDKNESNYHVGKGATAYEGGEIKVTTFNNPLGRAYINFLGNFIIDNNSSYIDLSNIFKFKASFETKSIKILEKDAKEIEPCVNINSVGHVGGVLGKFNIVHEHGGNSDFSDINSPQNQLYTQIVNKPFKVKIIHLNDSSDKLSIYTGDVNITLIEDTFSDTDTDEEKQIKCNNAVPITSWTPIKFNNESSKIVDFIYNKAIRDVRFKISYMDRGKVKFSCSTDDFSIRPNKYLITSIDKKLTAGEDINITVQALDYNNNLIRNFNFSNAPVELNITDAMGCITGNVTKPSTLKTNIDFIDGLGKFTFNYSEVGDLNISIKEYKNGNEFAKVDENDPVDSYGNVISDKVLLVGEGNSTIKRFYPASFIISGNFKDFNDSGFTYLSNDLNMSSKLTLNIYAVNKNKSITKNYTKSCYARNSRINITYEIPSDVPNCVNKIWVLMNNGFFSVNRGDIIKKAFPKSLFEHGEANITTFINLKRIYNIPVKNFDFVIKDINMSDDINTFGDLNLSTPVHIRYGRLALKGEIVTYSSNEINTTVKYMYWDKVKGWIINKDHNSSVYGDIDLNNTYVAANGVKLLKNSDLNISKGNIKNGDENLTILSKIIPYSAKIHFAIPSWLWYHPLAKTYKSPSTTNINCLTHPCTKVTYLKTTKGWAGVGRDDVKYSEKNTTTKVNVSPSTTSKDANKKEVKKLSW